MQIGSVARRAARSFPGSMPQGLIRPALAGALVLAASLANFLHYHGYPLLRAEIAMLIVGIAGLALFMAFVYRDVRPSGRAVLEGLLVFFALDLNADALPAAIAAGLSIALFVWWKGRSLLPLLSVFACVVLVSTLAGLGDQRAAVETKGGPAQGAPVDAPAVLHIILDEHIGIEGLPADNPRTPALQAALKSFYLSRDFRLFGRAYSQHLHTVNAVPHILNFGGAGSSRSSRGGVRIGSNAYLKGLRADGYRIKIYQSEFADICSDSSYSFCRTYWSASLQPTLSVPASASERAALILAKFLSLSKLATAFAKGYDIAALMLSSKGIPVREFDLERREHSSTVAALAAFDGLIGDLRSARPGEAYVAHMLLPHYPYITTPACELLPPSRWEVRYSKTEPATRQNAYYNQLRCTLSKVGAAYDALSRSPAGGNFVMIVHGDHGSRITVADPTVSNAGLYRDSDMIAGFSTLFAVRSPRLAPGYGDDPVPVASLLGSLAQSGFSAVPAHTQQAKKRSIVYLDDTEWKPAGRASLPRSWR